jgi:two-component system, response regulator RegA
MTSVGKGTSNVAGSIGPVAILDGDLCEAEHLRREFDGLGICVRRLPAEEAKISELLMPFQPGTVVVDPGTIVEANRAQDWIIEQLRKRFLASHIVVHTRRYSLADCFGCARAGASAYLPKPASAAEIIALLGGKRPENHEVPHWPPSLARVEWEHLRRVLAACGGNKSRAAALLNIPRFTLQRKLRKEPPAR